ncbi:Protein of unknown function DUF716 (TMEM45) [Trinorchestia longiramus]|nr:Protein of unknown function DUF716 (TMEM45) [Trinorchestia longiramus]
MESLVLGYDTTEHDGIENFTTEDYVQEHAAAGHPETSHYLKDYGKFDGHFVSGTISLVYGLLWTYNVIKRYQIARREAVLTRRDPNKLNFQCSLFSQYYDGCCSRLPVEAFVLVVGTIIVFFGEVKGSFVDGKFIMTGAHHVVGYFFLHLVGVSNILMYYKHAVPPRSDLAVLIVAALADALLLTGHVKGRAPLNSQIHILEMYLVLGVVVFCGLELLNPCSVLASLGRTLCITVRGQWLCTIAVMIYPPAPYVSKLDPEDHNSLALMLTIFVTLIALGIVSTFITNYAIMRRVTRLSLPTINRMQTILNCDETRKLNYKNTNYRDNSLYVLVPPYAFIVIRTIGCVELAVLRGNNSKNLNYMNFFFSVYHSGWAQVAPVEAIAFVVLPIMSMIGDTIVMTIHMPVIMGVQHLLIYFFFCMMGVTSLLQHYKFVLPPSSEYAAFIMAQGASAFILINHLSGRSIVNHKMHITLVNFHLLVIVCVAVELLNKRNVTAALGRTLIVIAQGIYLCVTGFILYPYSFMPSWDLNDHVLLQALTPIAVVTVVIALMIGFLMNFIISKQVQKMKLSTVDRIVALTYNRWVSSNGKGEAASPLISDSDCEA